MTSAHDAPLLECPRCGKPIRPRAGGACPDCGTHLDPKRHAHRAATRAWRNERIERRNVAILAFAGLCSAATIVSLSFLVPAKAVVLTVAAVEAATMFILARLLPIRRARR